MHLLASHLVQTTPARHVDSWEQISSDVAAMEMLLDKGIMRDEKRIGAVALSHVQVANPGFSFFVLDNQFRKDFSNRRVIVNARIVDQRELVDFMEGCLSFDGKHPCATKRFRYIEVEWQYPKSDGTLKFPRRDRFEGFPAIVMQHEIDHANGLNVYQQFAEYI